MGSLASRSWCLRTALPLVMLAWFGCPKAAWAQPRGNWEHAVCSFERDMRTTDDHKQRKAISKELRSAKKQGFQREMDLAQSESDNVRAFVAVANACWFTCSDDVHDMCESKKQSAHAEATKRGKEALAAGDYRQAAYLLRVAAGISSSPETRDALGQALAHLQPGDPRLQDPAQLVAADPPQPITCREYLTQPEIGLLIDEPMVATNREADEKQAACLATWRAPDTAQGGPPIPGQGPPIPPRGKPVEPWRRTFHESYSYIGIASIDVDPELPDGVAAVEGNDAALALVVRGVKVWRPRDWKVLPWMEAGVDFGTTQFSSDPPEGGDPVQFVGLAGAFGADVRIVPWNEQKLNLAVGPLIGGHLDGFTEADGASYGWDWGGRIRGLWEKKAGKAPKLMGELRAYRRTDKASSATYGEVQGGVGISSVVLFGFYRTRMSVTTPDDPGDGLGDLMPFASFLGLGIRMYSDRE
jgi:hypothetical protein